jgi:hypothetical protein
VDRNQQRPGCARGNRLLHSKHSPVVRAPLWSCWCRSSASAHLPAALRSQICVREWPGAFWRSFMTAIAADGVAAPGKRQGPVRLLEGRVLALVLDLLCVGSALCWIWSVLDLLCVGSLVWISSGSALCWICSVLDLLSGSSLDLDLLCVRSGS